MLTYEQLTQEVKKIFEIYLKDTSRKTPETLWNPVYYAMSQGGKRIRPTLLLAATDLFGGNISDAANAAIGIEVFHNFTLLHDDLMDQSPIRRGQPTVYKKWNPNTAILSGDVMTAQAWDYFLAIDNDNNNKHNILSTFNQICTEIYEGQQLDMDLENESAEAIDATDGMKRYINMIQKKTAVLLAGALKIGALHTKATGEDIAHLYNFGIALGIAFQLRDDLLDVWGDPSIFGKQTGTDIRDNKKTYPFFQALLDANTEQKEQLSSLFDPMRGKNLSTESKVERTINLFNALNIKEKTQRQIEIFHKHAMEYLDAISSAQQQKSTLMSITSTLLNRNY